MTEPARSAVSPPSLLPSAVTKSMAARFFSVTVNALRAGSNKEGERASFALLVAIGCGLGECFGGFGGSLGEKEKGIWSKTKEGQ